MNWSRIRFPTMMKRSSVLSDDHDMKDVPLMDDRAGLANDNIRLPAKMSLLNGITVIVGSIIGSGIFVSPTGVQKFTGSSNMSLIVWFSSGIFSMVRLPCRRILKIILKYNVIFLKLKFSGIIFSPNFQLHDFTSIKEGIITTKILVVSLRYFEIRVRP